MSNFTFYDLLKNQFKKMKRWPKLLVLLSLLGFSQNSYTIELNDIIIVSDDSNYCEASTTLVGNSVITSFITTGGITNISNDTGLTSSPNGYSDFTNFSVSHFETGEVSFTITTNNFEWSSGVNIWIDWNDNKIFEESEKISSTNLGNNSFIGTFLVPISVPAGNYRIRVRGNSFTANNPTPCGTIFGGETEDYTFTVMSPPNCLSPNQLDANIISPTSIELFWVSEGTSFEVQYGLENFNLGEGIILTDITNNSTILLDLEPATHYHYYVREECNENEFSSWAGPYLFYIVYCEAYSSGAGSYIASFSTTGGINSYNIENTTGNSNNPNSYGNYTDMSVHHFETGTIDFAVTTSGNLAVSIWVDWNNNVIFEESEKVATFYSGIGIGTETYSGSFSVPLGTPIGNYRIRVRGESLLFNPNSDLLPCGIINSGETEDYTITVITPSNCTSPTQLGFNLISLTSGELFWTGEGTNFEVQYGLQNFSLGEGITIGGITGTSTILLGLEPDTYYQYYVRKECSEGGFSFWAGPYLLYTNYCEAFSSGTTSNITSFVTIGGISNISNYSGTIGSSNGYGDFTDMVVSHFHTGEINFTLTSNDWFSVNIWIDWNNNMVFEESEKMYTIEYIPLIESFTGTFAVPFGTPQGDYRMRVRGIGLLDASNPSPCGTIFGGETEDYTFSVVSPPSCLSPFILESVNTSATSVSLSWLSDGDLFDIEYGPSGFISGEGISITGVGNPYVLSWLTAGTTYDYYVRQNCGNDDYSAWSGSHTFVAGAYIGAIPTLFNANPQVDDIACATSFSIEVPEGQYLSALNVQYTMLSVSPYWTSQQRSILYSPTLGTSEPQVITADVASEDYPGFIIYNRNVDFADGATGTIEFELKAWRTDGGTDCSIDQVFVIDGSWILSPSFEFIPTCPNPPSDLDYTNIMEDSVDLIWTSDETGIFQIKWGNVGFDPETEGNTISGITTNYYSLQELDSSISYEFYVHRDCSTDDEEDYGEWVGPVRFNSGHCIPFSPNAFYFTVFNTNNALENVTYSYSGPDLGTGYVNNTGMIISQEVGESFNFSSNYIGGASGLRIWVDWNKDFVFEDDEEMFFLASPISSKSGTITVPAGTEAGNYRIRIRAQQGVESIPSACGGINTGEAMDFTLNIPCGPVDAPVGDTPQEFVTGDTLIDLDVTGNNLVWYADEGLTIVLEDTTLLVDQTTYYVVSINGSCQSVALAVFVEEALNTSDFNSFEFAYYPNPVTEVLYLKAKNEINEVVVFNMLGQKLNLPVQSDNTQIDMRGLLSGNYVLNVTIEGITKTFKIVK